MSAYTEFQALIERISTDTNIIRTRSEDQLRREVNGGENGELEAKVASAVKDLKKTAAKLEKALA